MGLVSAWRIEMIRTDHHAGIEGGWISQWLVEPWSEKFICGPNGRNIKIDPILAEWDPQVGDFFIQWHTGLITVRKEESFKRDFDHLRQDLYYTELEPLFAQRRPVNDQGPCVSDCTG